MRALLSREPGGPETLELAELPDPEPGPGQLLVAVRACSINYPDVLMIEDKYQFRPPRPFAPGGEIAGIVEAVGEEVEGWSPGDQPVMPSPTCSTIPAISPPGAKGRGGLD